MLVCVLVALCGGVGAARMLSGLVRVVPPSDVTAVVNVADDMELHGLHISPDLDTVTYTLAGLDNRETGWGVAGESWTVMEELGRWAARTGSAWATGTWPPTCSAPAACAPARRLSTVTAELARRRRRRRAAPPGHRRPGRTRVTLAEASVCGPAGTEVASRSTSCACATTWPCAPCASTGADGRRPAPGVLEAIETAERDRRLPVEPDRLDRAPAGRPRRAATPSWHGVTDVVAVSPIVAGAALKGPADRLMANWASSRRSSAWPASTRPGSAPW